MKKEKIDLDIKSLNKLIEKTGMKKNEFITNFACKGFSDKTHYDLFKFKHIDKFKLLKYLDAWNKFFRKNGFKERVYINDLIKKNKNLNIYDGKIKFTLNKINDYNDLPSETFDNNLYFFSRFRRIEGEGSWARSPIDQIESIFRYLTKWNPLKENSIFSIHNEPHSVQEIERIKHIEKINGRLKSLQDSKVYLYGNSVDIPTIFYDKKIVEGEIILESIARYFSAVITCATNEPDKEPTAIYEALSLETLTSIVKKNPFSVIEKNDFFSEVTPEQKLLRKMKDFYLTFNPKVNVGFEESKLQILGIQPGNPGAPDRID